MYHGVTVEMILTEKNEIERDGIIKPFLIEFYTVYRIYTICRILFSVIPTDSVESTEFDPPAYKVEVFPNNTKLAMQRISCIKKV